MTSRTVWDIYETSKSSWISFGCKNLDSLFKGIPCKGITELTGEAGSGKTQLSMSLVVQAVICGEETIFSSTSSSSSSPNRKLRGAAIISCGEGTYPIKRLNQIASGVATEEIPLNSILHNVHISNCRTIEDLLEIVMKTIPEMCQKNKLKIIVIDSIAGLLRYEFKVSDSKEMMERSRILFLLAEQLKKLADIYNIAVICINHVSKNKVSPALGLVWATCINQRFLLERKLVRNLQYFNETSLSFDDENALEDKNYIDDDIYLLKPDDSNNNEETISKNLPHPHDLGGTVSTALRAPIYASNSIVDAEIRQNPNDKYMNELLQQNKIDVEYNNKKRMKLDENDLENDVYSSLLTPSIPSTSSSSSSSSFRRIISLVLSPYQKETNCIFEITTEKITGIL